MAQEIAHVVQEGGEDEGASDRQPGIDLRKIGMNVQVENPSS